MNFLKNPLRFLWLLGFLIALVSVAIFAWKQHWDGINLTLNLTDLVSRMTPLILAATFIERSVEILISPWRDAPAAKLQNALNAIKSRPVAADAATAAINAEDLKVASQALDDYRGDTQRHAFAVSLVLSFLAAVAGVRGLWSFVSADPNTLAAYKALSNGQREYFQVVDVILSGTLLAGGADALHAVLNSITTFFNATANKVSSPPPPTA
ncbi:MAG TPA: hypothetical protein VHZ52_17615 [Acidobacteriaceae bacterium]|jgi:hypothetical protein|nr:hypothetical protein [Acidobacteriaceae bacterium]